MAEYVVKEGDTLSEILYENTGDGSYAHYTEVAEANGITDPNLIVPGQVITYDTTDTGNTGGGTGGSGGSGGNGFTPSTPSADDGWDLGSEAEEDIFGGDSGNTGGGNGGTGGNGSTTTQTPTNTDDGWDLGAEDEEDIFGDKGGSGSTGGNGSSASDAGGKAGTTGGNGSTTSDTGGKAGTTGGNGSTSGSGTTGGNGSTSGSKGGTTGGNGSSSGNKGGTTGGNSSSSKPSGSTSGSSPQVIGNDKTLYFGENTGDEICWPDPVNGWTPLNSFKTFIVKENAGEEFVAVNNKIKKCGEDIDQIQTALKTIKTKMGKNCGCIDMIDDISFNLGEKKQDLITKNKELITACEQVVQYIYENKSSKSQEASEVQRTISNISLYEG